MTPHTKLKLEKTPAGSFTSAAIIAAAPIVALLATLSRDIAYISDRLPGSSDIAILQRFHQDLARALDEARCADVWLSPKDVAEYTGKGLSTVTKECRDHADAAGAIRNGKRGWMIHWPTYQSWMVAKRHDKKAA